MTDLRKTAAIVGVDESDEIGKVPDKSNLQHHAEAAHKALADAGMEVGEVNSALKKHFEKVGATMSEEWKAKAGDRGAAVLSAYK